MMKRISLPLYQLVKKGIFKWTQAESTSRGNLLYLVRLHLKNYIFKPERVLFILADTSAVETSAFCTQWDPNTLNLNTVAAKPTEALRRQSPVHREAFGVSCAMTLVRPHLLTTKAPVNYLFTDASSISYIGRTKYFSNLLMDLSLEILLYPTLQAIQVPGRVI